MINTRTLNKISAIKIFIFSAAVFSSLAFYAAPALVNAADTSTTNCTFDANSTKLCSPVKEQTLTDFVVRIIEYTMGLVAAVSVVALIIAGFRMVISAGNAETLKGAKSQATYAVAGLAVAILSYSIIAIVLNALNNK